MITNNAQSPKVGSSVKTFEEWKQENPTLVLKLDEQQLREAYEQYKRSVGGLQLTSTNPATGIEDVSEEKQTTELNNKKAVNNIDMMGVTDTFTQLGLATGNQNMTKAGILGNSTVKALQQLKATKGLTGVNKTAGVTGAVGGLADTADQMFFGDQAAKNSDLTNSINSAYDMASSAIMTMGPYGAIIGGAMKIGGLLSDGLTALGVGTDQMTTTDQILDSKFMKLTPVGLINGIGASTSDKFSVDSNVREQIGGSYKGAYSFMDDAASKANKKYGLFSSGARNDANEQIGKAKVMLGKVSSISKEARDRRSIVSSTNDLLSTSYQYNLAGGYDQRYLRAAKEGAKIERIKKINLTFRKGGQIHNIINLETKEIEWKPVIIEDEVPEFKNGGNIEWQYDNWEPTLIEDEWKPDIVDIFKEGGSIEKEWQPEITEEVLILQTGGEVSDSPKIENKEEKKQEERIDEDIITLEDYIEQKILERTEAALKKATTRKTPYRFKNKNWKNCIATATDNFGIPIVMRNADLAADPNKWGFEELSFNSIDDLPYGALIQDYNKENDTSVPGHTIMYVGYDENLGEPLYSYSSGDSNAKSMHNYGHYRFRRWDEDGVRPRAYRYIGTPAERKAWEEEYNQLYKPFMKEGGKTEESEEEPLSNQQNVIPEGALHARKHHMENTDGLTLKGIPVIDDKGELQAEIELNEIIFNLEVTKKLEELCKDGSDEAAIEAGKLLVQEILFNTEDRTGLIKTLKLGGTINGGTE